MSRAKIATDYIGPLRPQDVEAMGLTLGPICTVHHRPAMKAHRHIDLPIAASEPSPSVSHECPTCGDVHLPRAEGGQHG